MYEYELTNLLREVSAINKKYEGIAEATGENFNIFRILKMETREVTTHSAFHAELLNPKGSHGQGDIFLKLFLNQQREKQKNHPEFLRLFEKFDTSKCKVYKEKHIGFKNIDETEGGRIDILLSDAKNNVIVIENKIYGVEQPNWLVRYYNACPAAAIFYLTLNAVPPDNNNKGELSEGKHFVNISYKKDILEWMQVCQKEAKNHPLLGGTIAQYINLIKHLTNQTMNELTTEEIVNTIVKNPENIQAAQDISTGTVWTDVRLKIIQNMLKSITQIANSLRIEVIVDEGYILGKQYSGFSLFKKEWKHCIYFHFPDDFETLLIGIDFINSENKDPEFTEISYLTKILVDLNIGPNSNHPNWLWVSTFQIWNETDWKDIEAKITFAIAEIMRKL